MHRDIEPGNFLLTNDHDVRISDISVALMTRPDSTTTQAHGHVGSPLFQGTNVWRCQPEAVRV